MNWNCQLNKLNCSAALPIICDIRSNLTIFVFDAKHLNIFNVTNQSINFDQWMKGAHLQHVNFTAELIKCQFDVMRSKNTAPLTLYVCGSLSKMVASVKHSILLVGSGWR